MGTGAWHLADSFSRLPDLEHILHWYLADWCASSVLACFLVNPCHSDLGILLPPHPHPVRRHAGHTALGAASASALRGAWAAMLCASTATSAAVGELLAFHAYLRCQGLGTYDYVLRQRARRAATEDPQPEQRLNTDPELQNHHDSASQLGSAATAQGATYRLHGACSDAEPHEYDDRDLKPQTRVRRCSWVLAGCNRAHWCSKVAPTPEQKIAPGTAAANPAASCSTNAPPPGEAAAPGSCSTRYKCSRVAPEPDPTVARGATASGTGACERDQPRPSWSAAAAASSAGWRMHEPLPPPSLPAGAGLPGAWPSPQSPLADGLVPGQLAHAGTALTNRVSWGGAPQPARTGASAAGGLWLAQPELGGTASAGALLVDGGLGHPAPAALLGANARGWLVVDGSLGRFLGQGLGAAEVAAAPRPRSACTAKHALRLPILSRSDPNIHLAGLLS